MVENTVVLRPPRTGRTCVFGRVMSGFWGRRLGIWICFPNRVYISVGGTAVFFEPGIYFGWGYGHVFATYGWRLWGVCCCAPTHVTCHKSKYGYVFRTGYTLPIEIRKCFPNRIHIIHQNTNVFSEPGTRYPSKYECVFRTGHKRSIEIRPCFPNRIHIIHQNTNVFSKLGTNDPSKYGRVFRIR